MDIVINTAGIERFLNLPPEQMFWAFFANIGWIIIAIAFLIGVKSMYLLWLKTQWGKDHEFVILAIDVPKGNEQSPKAVENMFTYLGGAHGTHNFFEKWFEGQYQKSFSYEIVSLEGYTQFLIRTPIEFRNLIESSIYSQYPDAEITEVDDYTDVVPKTWPDEEYDIWGTEFIQAKKPAYPIKTYKEFEHQLGPSETHFKDPMASLMDLCGSLRKDEYFWMQLIVIPTGFDWPDESEKEIDKILERKKKTKKGLTTKGVEALGEASEAVFSIWGDIENKEEQEKKSKSMIDLTPKEKRQVEGIHEKASKLGFETKIRIVYIAKKEVMNKAKVANGTVGYMKQFASLDLNNLKPDLTKTMTRAHYFRKRPRLNRRKRRIFNYYVSRSGTGGRKAKVFTIDELASLWHFPVETVVKAPLVQKAPGRKADAPSSLPMAEEMAELPPDIFTNNIFKDQETKNSASSNDLDDKDTTPPDNLPVV